MSESCRSDLVSEPKLPSCTQPRRSPKFTCGTRGEDVLAAVSRTAPEVSHSIGLGHHFQWSIIQVCHQIPFMLAHDFEDGHQSILDPGLVPEIKGVTR